MNEDMVMVKFYEPSTGRVHWIPRAELSDNHVVVTGDFLGLPHESGKIYAFGAMFDFGGGPEPVINPLAEIVTNLSHIIDLGPSNWSFGLPWIVFLEYDEEQGNSDGRECAEVAAEIIDVPGIRITQHVDDGDALVYRVEFLREHIPQAIANVQNWWAEERKHHPEISWLDIPKAI
jgi:hypothetical protein